MTCFEGILKGSRSRIQDVGRTINPVRRNSEHQADQRDKWIPFRPFILIPVATGLTENEARVLKQALIVGYTFKALTNVRNSIAPWRLDAGQFLAETERIRTLFRIVT